MNTKVFIVKMLAVSFALFFLTPTSFASVSKYSEQNFESIGERPQEELIKSRLENISGNIDVAYTKEVHDRIIQYTVKHRNYTEKLLGKAIKYFPMFEEKLREYDLPQELKYIAVVESLLNPSAKSRSGALGLWQFMPSTGRYYGLEKNNTVDQRADPVLATEAAFTYLADLYNQFDDWTLAIAAYNCGPGNIRKAIRKSGKKNYWELRNYLPRETQKYVPRIIAASYLMNYYHKHDLSPRGYKDSFQNTVGIEHTEDIVLSDLSEKLNVDLDLLHEINPMYKTDKMPSGSGYTIRIPDNRLYLYYSMYQPQALAEVFESKGRTNKQRRLIQRDSLEHLEKIVSYYEIQNRA